MNDARRFLRYLLPGLLYAMETLVLLYIVLPDVAKDVVIKKNDDGNLVLLVTTFFASGALGFVFSSIHHCVHWYLDSKSIDHTNFIAKYQDFITKQLTKNENCKSTTNNKKKKRWLSKWYQCKKEKHHKREEAFIQLLVLWYTRLQSEGQLAGADKKTVALGDLAHASGTARIASFFAIMTVLLLCFYLPNVQNSINLQPVRFASSLSLGYLILLLFRDAYYRTSRYAQEVIEGILGKILDDEWERKSAEAYEKGGTYYLQYSLDSSQTLTKEQKGKLYDKVMLSKYGRLADNNPYK
jgi:hypothetical protein